MRATIGTILAGVLGIAGCSSHYDQGVGNLRAEGYTVIRVNWQSGNDYVQAGVDDFWDQVAEEEPELLQRVVLIGHSNGGAIAANLAVRYAQYNLPEVIGVMGLRPCAGANRSLALDDYSSISVPAQWLIGNSDNLCGGDSVIRNLESTRPGNEFEYLDADHLLTDEDWEYVSNFLGALPYEKDEFIVAFFHGYGAGE